MVSFNQLKKILTCDRINCYKCQGWEFALLLIRSSLFCSKLLFFLRATVSDLLSLLFTKEPPKANRSRCSLQKSHHEWFTLFQEPIAIWLFSKSEFLFRSFSRANSDSLFSKSESLFQSFPRANRYFSFFPRGNLYFTFSLTKNERFAQKTNEQIPNPVKCRMFKSLVAVH